MDFGSQATTNELALVGIVATLGGLALALWSLRSQLKSQVDATRAQTRALSVQTMIPYADKYEAIVADMSSAQQLAGFWGLPRESVTEGSAMRAFLRYCNLCSQECYLASRALEADLWGVWQDEMKKVFQSPFGRAAWAELQFRGHFDSHSAFKKLVNSWLAEIGVSHDSSARPADG